MAGWHFGGLVRGGGVATAVLYSYRAEALSVRILVRLYDASCLSAHVHCSAPDAGAHPAGGGTRSPPHRSRACWAMLQAPGGRAHVARGLLSAEPNLVARRSSSGMMMKCLRGARQPVMMTTAPSEDDDGESLQSDDVG